MDRRGTRRRPGDRPDTASGDGRWLAAPVRALFLVMFAGQASLLVLTPILTDVSADLGVSTSVTAQLRSLTGLVAGGVALWLGVRSKPHGLRDLLAAGLVLISLGAIGSAAAPTFPLLLAGQLSVGVGLGVILPTALAAAGSWAPEQETRMLAWALAGQPLAWVVGMPLVGLVADVDWRLAWLAVPLVSSLAALGAVLARPRDAAPPSHADEPSMWSEPGTRGWAAGELLAYGGWAGTLVFVGALLVDAYAISASAVGLVLAAGAAAYVPGNFLARRWANLDLRRVLVGGALISAGLVAVLATIRASLAVSAAAFAALAFVAGARTFAGSALGLRLAPRCRLKSMGFRTAAVQYGYLLGAGVGGVAIAVGGYPMLGLVLGTLFGAAAVPHLVSRRHPRARQPAGTAT